MKTKYREEAVYAAVRMGLMEIRADGSVWRVKYRRRNRWNNKVAISECDPKRIDAPVGVGYRTVKVMMDGKQVCCLAHRLVWLHFNGPIPMGLHVNHINGKKADNRPENLELVTPAGNTKHAYRTGLHNQAGTRNNHTKLTPMDVEAIRTEYAAGRRTQAEIAKEYGVVHQTVSRIVRGDRMPREPGPTADYTSRRARGERPRNAKGQFRS